jgi:hypothetical protein
MAQRLPSDRMHAPTWGGRAIKPAAVAMSFVRLGHQ